MKKIAILFADGFEELEMIAVTDILRRGGVQADLVSMEKEFNTSAHQVVVKADMLLKDVDLSKYDGIFIPGGGKGAENLAASELVRAALRQADESNHLIAAICAGPTVLEAAGILKGVSVTSYPGLADEFQGSSYIPDVVSVSDGNILTSRGPATAPYFGFDILQYLGLEKEAEKIYEGMQYSFLDKSGI